MQHVAAGQGLAHLDTTPAAADVMSARRLPAGDQSTRTPSWWPPAIPPAVVQLRQGGGESGSLAAKPVGPLLVVHPERLVQRTLADELPGVLPDRDDQALSDADNGLLFGAALERDGHHVVGDDGRPATEAPTPGGGLQIWCSPRTARL
ncbi:hypothetical protein ACFV4M_03950 [Kitasatospora indigofera]|uniref:hypothetical protein n=1 Tax=Kitasatospora indigofera TaxID=67307 RepID=UPI003652AEE7